jgi:hypothetical protein
MSFMDDDAHDGHGENHKQAEEKQVDTDFFNGAREALAWPRTCPSLQPSSRTRTQRVLNQTEMMCGGGLVMGHGRARGESTDTPSGGSGSLFVERSQSPAGGRVHVGSVLGGGGCDLQLRRTPPQPSRTKP